MEAFERAAWIRGYHVYKEIWEAAVDEELACEREPHNANDCYAVAVKRRELPLVICHESYQDCSLFSFATGRYDILYSDWRKKILRGSASRRSKSTLHFAV